MPWFYPHPMFEATVSLMGERAEKIKTNTSLDGGGRRVVQPTLVSDDSSFVTGVALPVDGYTAGHWYGLTTLMGLE